MRKLVVISGGSRGIGLALAHRFAQGGFAVAVSGRDPQSLALACQSLHVYNVPIYPFEGDMADPATITLWAKELQQRTEKLSVVILNAGRFQVGSFLDETWEDFRGMMALNVEGAYLLAKALVPRLIAQKEGHVFTIGSIAGLMAHPQSSGYTISKFAMQGLTKVLRETLKPYGVRVTGVLPGGTLTDSWSGVPVSAERLMPVEDIAELVWSAHLVSSRSVVEEIVIRPQLGDVLDLG